MGCPWSDGCHSSDVWWKKWCFFICNGVFGACNTVRSVSHCSYIYNAKHSYSRQLPYSEFDQYLLKKEHQLTKEQLTDKDLLSKLENEGMKVDYEKGLAISQVRGWEANSNWSDFLGLAGAVYQASHPVKQFTSNNFQLWTTKQSWGIQQRMLLREIWRARRLWKKLGPMTLNNVPPWLTSWES